MDLFIEIYQSVSAVRESTCQNTTSLKTDSNRSAQPYEQFKDMSSMETNKCGERTTVGKKHFQLEKI